MQCLCATILIVIGTTLLIRFFKTKDPEKIFNVYRRPGKWYYLKYTVAYLAIVLSKYFHLGRSAKDGSTPGYGLKSKATIADMDKIQPLAKDAPLAVDAVFFNGASKDGYYVAINVVRRPNDIMNAFWQLRIPNVGLLVSPKHPDTTLKAEPNAYSTDGMTIEPIEPMKKWKISYDGQMKFHDDKSEKLIPVSMRLEWQSDLPYFDCDTDMLPAPGARAIAREPWSRTYFDNMKKSHQTHHEQMGYMKGTVTVEGHGEYNLNLNSLRDHSYARERDWTLMHRYALHNVTVEDGTKFTVGIISIPIMFSEIEFGYLYTPDDQLSGIDSCDLKLYEHGERGVPPLDYAFSFKAFGKTYFVQCNVLESPEVYIGLEWETRIIERMCQFTVNGKLGWGFAEWDYRRHGGSK